MKYFGVLGLIAFGFLLPTSIYAANTSLDWSKRLGASVDVITTNSNDETVAIGTVSGTADLNGDGDTTDPYETAAPAPEFTTDIFISQFDSTGTHQWTKRLQGTGDDQYSTVLDGNDRIVIVGLTWEGDDLNGDGDSEDFGEVSAEPYEIFDIFITVFNSSGTHQWSKRLGGNDIDRSLAIAVSNDGNVIVSGNSEGTADLNGDGDTTDPDEMAIERSAFLTVFNSSGTHQWSKRLGNEYDEEEMSVTTDTEGNVILTGNVHGTADLNGDGDTVDEYEELVAPYSLSDVFMSVFSSSSVHQWSKRLGGADNDDGSDVTTDNGGNIIISGNVSGAVDLNGDGDTTDLDEITGDGSYFFSVFDSTGTHQWSKRLSNVQATVLIDSNGFVVVTGRVSGHADLNGDGDMEDSGEVSTAPYSSFDVFITVFDSSGTLQWSKRLGGTYADTSVFYDKSTATIDSDNNIIIGGKIGAPLGMGGSYPAISGTADLNGDGDISDPKETVEYTGFGDAFVSVFNSSGIHQWSRRIHGSDHTSYGSGASVSSITTDQNGLVSLSGQVSGSADLNGDGDTEDENEVSTATELMAVFASSYDFTQPTLSLDPTISGASPSVTGTTGSASSTIFTVEYQVNATSGAWSACTASDSTFDEASEAFTCAVSVGRSAGTYTAYVRSTDMNWNMTTGGSEASVAFTITPPPSGGGGGGSSSRKKEAPATTTVATTTTGNATKSLSQQGYPTVGASTGGNDLIMLIKLFISLGIIPAEKAELARSVVAQKSGQGTGATTALPVSFRFTRTMNVGDTNPEVHTLQQFLNARGFVVAPAGPGSIGNETNYFGPATKSAVAKFQEAYRADILTPAGLLMGTGYFGPSTMKKANTLLNL